MASRKTSLWAVIFLVALLALPSWSQQPLVEPSPGGGPGDDPILPRGPAEPALLTPVSLPRMAPELALAAYEQGAARQASALGASSDTTIVAAELPGTAQKGEFQLKRYYAAPKNLTFAALKFVGDGFVKTNVILRLLQSEVDHVEKGQGPATAISLRNYRFSYKGTELLDGRPVHVFQAKPRQKRVGLFKGKIYLDVYTGGLRRAEGTLVKSPSFFVKKVEFVQDYADVGGFTLPVHIHSTASTRLFGRAIVDIYHRDYQAQAATDVPQPASLPTAGLGSLQQ